MHFCIMCSGTFDFFGINHYTTRYVSHGIDGPKPSMQRDSGAVAHIDPSWPSSASDWLKVGNSNLLTFCPNILLTVRVIQKVIRKTAVQYFENVKLV